MVASWGGRFFGQLAEIETAVPAQREPHQEAHQGGVRAIPAVVRGDPGEVEEALDVLFRKDEFRHADATCGCDPIPRRLQPLVHARDRNAGRAAQDP